MRVKMLTLSAGPEGIRTVGGIYTVDDAEGQQLVDGGFAELVEASKPKASKPAASGKGAGKKDENPKPPADTNPDSTPDPDDAGEGEEGGEGADGAGAPSA